MKKLKKLLIIIFAGLMGLIGYFKYDDFAYGSYERSMIKFAAGIFNVSQEAYKAEFKVYSINKAELKTKLLFTDEVVGYIDINDLPEEFRDKLRADDQPILSESSYKVAVVIKSKRYNKSSLWMFDNAEVVKKIYPQ